MSHDTLTPTSVFLIAGLGNPGPRYDGTRHNVGFRVVDRLAQRFSIPMQERKFPAHWGEGRIGGRKVVLVKPMTYMNRSGEAVGPILRYYRLPPEALLVVHDDLDLPLGRIRIARRGGTGGHRGVASIIQTLGGGEFARLKLGIGRPRYGESVEAFVLDGFYSDELEAAEEMVDRAAAAALAVLADGLEAAMNRFNQRRKSTDQQADQPGD
ncbi:peptidyl-tRNA hydrolase [Desulfacinum infernum DSM 9756]|uniref:Peptidyl-tRNA hydrolase n=1 Tax=Desulfacinum infernum DSM 9756 TaxID=1121391 RepID=A0A1M4YDJ2_9BACT|nr:aminoacyl-tRNA hydrolase [Desulfacinum infernum]SHF03830.1 peptidyl-tRNA hydrolase [Desulfacinum infernum DSM 9756]